MYHRRRRPLFGMPSEAWRGNMVDRNQRGRKVMNTVVSRSLSTEVSDDSLSGLRGRSFEKAHVSNAHREGSTTPSGMLAIRTRFGTDTVVHHSQGDMFDMLARSCRTSPSFREMQEMTSHVRCVNGPANQHAVNHWHALHPLLGLRNKFFCTRSQSE